MAGFFAHPMFAANIADQQACANRHDGRRNMKPNRKLIAAKRQRQGQQNLKRVVINLAHHPKNGPAQHQAKDCAAQSFLEEQPGCAV